VRPALIESASKSWWSGVALISGAWRKKLNGLWVSTGQARAIKFAASARVHGPNPGFPEAGGSHRTRRWREMDSNCRYPEDKLPLRDGLFRSTTVPVPERDSPLSRRGTDSSNPSPSTSESAANLERDQQGVDQPCPASHVIASGSIVTGSCEGTLISPRQRSRSDRTICTKAQQSTS
jgi:hypothetical protein